MATNLAIDSILLNQALAIGESKTKKDTVNTALKEYIQRRRAHEVVDMFGTVDYDDGYDYKSLRGRDL
jgi:Arc/MetJ family transcription regulator